MARLVVRHAWFEFSVAAGREAEGEGNGGEDHAPADGTFRYRL